jgi:hypothetical protein
MITANIGAIGDGATDRLQILTVILDAARIVNHSACVGAIVISAAALGNFNLRAIEVASDAHDHVVERLGPDFPSIAGLGALLASRHLHRKQPLLRV